MPRIFDFGGRDVYRAVTVASLIEQKGTPSRFTQVTAQNEEEAAAAEAAGIEMVVCFADHVERIREGSSKVFVTAVIDFSGATTEDELLKVAFNAMRSGADAIITARGYRTVSRIADEDIPVFGHLGFVPGKSTWYGGVRAIGKNADEALSLWDKFRRLEDAGAVGVECELIPAQVMKEINQRTGLVTISLGSGPHADVMFLFTSDICGETPSVPRHARAYGDIASLRRQIIEERVTALTSFRADVAANTFPDQGEIASIDSQELADFISLLDGTVGT